MKIPEAPCNDDLNARHKFYGEVVGSLACDSERLSRLQQLVDHIHEEQSAMINSVKKDLNGMGHEVRREIQDLAHNCRDDTANIYKDINKKAMEFDRRLDRAVDQDAHRRMGERFDGVGAEIDQKVGEVKRMLNGRIEKIKADEVEFSEKTDGRLKPLEQQRTILLVISTALVLSGGTIWSMFYSKIESIDMLHNQVKEIEIERGRGADMFNHRMDEIQKMINQLRAARLNGSAQLNVEVPPL